MLVDTSDYFALTDPRDGNHDRAVAARDLLIAERRHLFTTDFILAETHAPLLARLGRVTAATMLRQIDGSNTTIIRVSVADERRARAIIAQYDDKDFSLSDATSFAVMERARIGQAFTFDRNFAQFGLHVL